VGDGEALTFGDHLNELKRRSFLVFVNFLVGGVVGFIFHKQIEAILQEPLGQTLYYSSPAGGLAFVMQIAISVGLIASLPMLLYQIMQFIRPTLKPVKTRNILTMILLALLLSVMAVVYVYFVSLPAALKFLVSFNSESVQALINVNDYSRFVLAYMAGAIIAFQLPLLLFFMNKLRRFPPGGLTKTQGPVILGSIVAGGIITPTVDPINQILLAGPIIVLYEISVIAIWTVNRRYSKAHTTTAKAETREAFEYTYQEHDLRRLALPDNSFHAVVAQPLALESVQSIPMQVIEPQEEVKPQYVAQEPKRRLIMDVIVPAQ
jgi:sec-independent protein translocase protein TatC